MASSLLEFQKCQDIIYSDKYADYIIRAIEESETLQSIYDYRCIQRITYNYHAINVERRQDTLSVFERFGYRSFPKVYGLMDQSSMESIGVNKIRRQPYLDLLGREVLVGFIDTGIDYTNPLFKNPDNTSRVLRIWDQSIPGQENNDTISYGTEYTQEQINEALASDDPLSIVPSTDMNGHGTFMAGIAAGNIDPVNDFTGAAPLSQIAVVKVKEAKPYIRDFYSIPDEEVCYQENDIMLAISYLLNLAFSVSRPIVICIGVGTNLGDHNGDSFLEDYISAISASVGLCVTIAAGNEGSRESHFQGRIPVTSDYEDVEINVAEGEKGFVVELWADALSTFSVGLISPSGEFIERIPARLNQRQRVKFLLEPTSAYIYYEISEKQSGNELILIRFINLTAGIWRIRVFPGSATDSQYNMWLPIHNFIKDSTKFLRSNPDTTITSPGYVRQATTIGAYDHIIGSLYIYSSHGFAVDGSVKPDIVAPGVNVFGPTINNQFTTRSGTSVAAAHTAGAVALLFEWAIIQGNDITLSGYKVNRYLVRGALRTDMVYPNKEWGYGKLDIYNTFESLRTTL